MFASDFPYETAMEDALDEINETLKRKEDINEKAESHDTRRKRQETLQPLV